MSDAYRVDNGFDFGDYDKMDFANGVFYRTWADNSNSTGDNPDGTNALDIYTAAVTVGSPAGPAVINSTPRGNVIGAVDHIRFTFDESIRPHSFEKIGTAIPSFTDPNGNQIPVLSVTPVPGTNNTQFDVSFPAQGLAGTYTMVIGPKIRDRLGRWMDQDGDGFGHHGDSGDSYTATFTILGPSVTAVSPTGNNNLPGSVQAVRFTFNEPIVPATFTPDKVDSFVGPDGNQIPIAAVQVVPNSNNTQFDVTFATATLGMAGSYTMIIGPDIEDAFGNELAQAYSTQFGIAFPTITAFARNGLPTDPATNVRVTFNEPMNPATFDPSQVTRFTDPNGNPITVNSVTPVSGSNNTQFDIAFDPQTTVGTYTMTIGPNIMDPYGNHMSAAFTGTFTYNDDLIVNGSFEMQFTGWTPGPGWIITGPGHGDANAAGSGAVGSTTPLSQVIPTVVGQQYTFSFWYSRVDGTPAEIHAFFGGVDVYDEVNTPSHDYEFHTFTVTATSTSTTILFMGRNDPSYDLLDDVSVRPVHALAAAHGGSASAVSLASSIFSSHLNTLANSAVLMQGTAQAAGADPMAQPSSMAQAQKWDAIDRALMPASAMQSAFSLTGLTSHVLARPLGWADPWTELTGDDGLLL
jgi:hypothetical protein